MSDTRSTYRSDRYYIAKQHGVFVHERMVSAPVWWWYRAQFWRYDRIRGFRVLRHRNMRYA